jgi:hypothetical protein
MDQRYSGAKPEGNHLHKKNNFRPLGLIAAIGEANVAIASYKDFCRNPLCCGNRKFAKHTVKKCWRNKSNKLDNYQSNNAASKRYGRAHNGFKSDSRGKNLSGRHIKGSNSIINSGFNPSRAGGKFNSHDSPKFNGPVCNGEAQVKFSSNYGNCYYENKRPTSQPNNFPQEKSLQNRQNFGGMKRNARGKYNSAFVKNAINALGHTPNKHAK